MKVNILGCGPGWKDCMDGDGEIWGINDLHLSRRVDLIIDCHNMARAARGREELGRRGPEEVKACLKGAKKSGVPFYTTKKIKDMPNSIAYPLDEIIEEFDSDYFGSGVDYAIALAIHKGATEIHLWGILMILKFEYAHQKPSVEHWLGVAKGRGVKTVIHGQGSSILKTRNGLLYGFNTIQKIIKEQCPEFTIQDGLLRKAEI
jgi:hypothetical protein